MRLLLLHPPLLSAAVWRRLGPFLEAAGHEVCTPDLRPGGAAGWWAVAREAAVAATPRAEAVLAHSGAGVLAPVVIDALPAARAVVLIDAILPAAHGPTVTSAAMRARIAELAVTGVLPPWTSWWGEAVLAGSVPDPEDRALLSAEAPSLPEAFYDVPVPVPAGWEPAVRGYLQLSAAYDEHAAGARRRGWATARLPGQHLDLLRDPVPVARAVLALLGEP